MHDGHPSVAPSISRNALVRLDRQGWSPSEVRGCLDSLDDTGLRLLAIFGDPRCAARIDGEWVIVIADLVVPADPLRRLYRTVPSAVHGLGCPTAGIIVDALLLAATTGPLTPDRIDAMSGKLAPATWEGIESPAEARQRIAEQVNLLLDRGLIVEACASGGLPAWKLSQRGLDLANGAVRLRWQAVSRAMPSRRP